MVVKSSPFKIKITSVDTEPPTVSISQPQLGGVVMLSPGQPLVISGIASDMKSGVDYTEVLIDSGGYQRATGTGSWLISFSGVPAGVHTARARSRDKAGNYSAENVTGFTVQLTTIPPPPPILPPPPLPTDADYLVSTAGTQFHVKNVLTGAMTSGADAKTVIQNLIDSLKFIQGMNKKIGVLAGLFPLTGPISIDYPGPSIIGAGDSTIFKSAVRTNMFHMEQGASYIELGAFQIIGANLPTHHGNYAVRMRGVHHIKIRDLYIHDFDGMGVIPDDLPGYTPPSDLIFERLRIYNTDETCIGLHGTNVLATDIDCRISLTDPEAQESSPISFEVDYPHYIYDNVVLNGFKAIGGKRGVLIADYHGGNVSTHKSITIKNGTISDCWQTGLDMNNGEWQSITVNNVMIKNCAQGEYRGIAGVQYTNIQYANNGVNIGPNP